MPPLLDRLRRVLADLPDGRDVPQPGEGGGTQALALGDIRLPATESPPVDRTDGPD